MNKILIIQTAFIGDVILATPVLEKLHAFYPDAKLDFLLRKGNESLFDGHPFLNKIIIWDKRYRKYRNFISIIKQLRRNKYDCAVNIQRFTSTGIITAFSGAGIKIGFNKNPFSFLFDHSVKHFIGDGIHKVHEIDRNLSLIESIINQQLSSDNHQLIRLYPSEKDFELTGQYKKNKYLCIAPASVWYTKQYPVEKWIDFIKQVVSEYTVYLVGSINDHGICQTIVEKTGNNNIVNLSGKLSFLKTAALMKGATMNYTNDSAPLHIASAVNAPVTAIFCSTVTSFGFGPLSDKSFVVEIDEKLYCRPCGLHGFKSCPEKHFKCALNIKTEQLLKSLE